MPKNAKISNAVIRRLPRYRRYLKELEKAGIDKISSNEFSKLTGFTASQIRQDLNNFGGFGQQGYGYNVSDLHREISSILGLDREYGMVVVGAGNLGSAIAGHAAYDRSGFPVKGVFDIDPARIGKKVRNNRVLPTSSLGEFVRKNKIDIGIICTTGDAAQEIVDTLCEAGVRGVWNFTMADISVPEGIALENVYLSDSLHSLVYHINQE